jgi:hypothetical protein
MSKLKYCRFVKIDERICRCVDCGFEDRKGRQPDKLTRMCRTVAPAPPPLGYCEHLGDELRREKCETCAGNVVLKIFDCRLLGKETTIGQCKHCQHHTDLLPLIGGVDGQPVQQADAD